MPSVCTLVRKNCYSTNNNDEIICVTPGNSDNENLKNIQHADNRTNLLKDKNSLKNTLEAIRDISKVVGPELN